MNFTDSVQTWRYQLSNVYGEGWAIIFMDDTGCFTALSDWGNVSYRWSKDGLPEGGFKRFMAHAEDSYLLSKFGQRRKEYDPDKSLASVKGAIIKKRRGHGLTKEEAWDEWTNLKSCDDLRSEFDFGQWYGLTEIEDAGELYCTRYVNEVTGFVKNVMPRLRQLLQAELQESK